MRIKHNYYSIDQLFQEPLLPVYCITPLKYCLFWGGVSTRNVPSGTEEQWVGPTETRTMNPFSQKLTILSQVLWVTLYIQICRLPRMSERKVLRIESVMLAHAACWAVLKYEAPTGVVYICSRKSLNSVNQLGLIDCLKYSDTDIARLTWLEGFLVGSNFLSRDTVTCGVSQPSMLRPLLFNVFCKWTCVCI